MKLFVWVQHLWGRGHVRRMARIAEACAASGMTVTVAAGGPGGREAFAGMDGVTAHQLPPLQTRDAQYTELMTARGGAPDENYLAMRREALLGALRAAAPDIVLIELFPFGRRKFASEVLALIEAAQQLSTAPLIISSVRDIVEVKSMAKTAEMRRFLNDYFDAVLVHGDAALIPIDATAPWAHDKPVHYTGYVAPSFPDEKKSGVVVSAGSSASGAALLEAAAKAGAESAAPWHIFVPPGFMPPEERGNAHVHAYSEAFTEVLARAEVSISEAGYNTFAEAIAAGAKPVLAPYDEAGQTEQTLRTDAAVKAGFAVRPQAVTAEGLRAAVEAARSLPKPDIRLNGAAHTPVILKGLRGQAGAT